MKRPIYLLLATLLHFTLISCDSESPTDSPTPPDDVIKCDAGSVLNDKKECVCESGYERNSSDKCQLWSEKFVGEYSGQDGCGGNVSKVTISIVEGNKIKIENWGGFAQYVVVDVQDIDLINANDYVDQADRKFDIAGKLTGTNLVANYLVTYSNNTTESCSFSISKK